VEDAHDDGGRFGGVLAREAGGQGEAAFALVKDKDRPGAFAEDEIALPVAGFFTCINGLRPVMDGRAILDRDPFPALLAPAAPLFAAAQIEPELFPGLAGPVDEGVYGLRGQREQALLRAAFQPARNLFRRPAFREPGAHEGTPLFVLFEDGASLPALNIGSVSEARRVPSGGQPVALQLAADCGRMPPQRLGDGTHAMPGGPENGDLLSFLR